MRRRPHHLSDPARTPAARATSQTRLAASVALVALLLLGVSLVALLLPRGGDDGPQLQLERAVGPMGESELIAYVRNGGDKLGTGDRLRVECRDADERLVFRATQSLLDDRGIEVPHLHQPLPPPLLQAVNTCRGRGGALTLDARLRSGLR